MSTNLALPFYNNARTHPERLALSVNQRNLTYGEFAELVQRIAAWFQSRPGSDVKLVGILASRSLAAYAGLLGTSWAGAAYVPLNPDWPEQRLLSILQTTELDALVVDDRGLKLLSAQVLQKAPKHILATGSPESVSLEAAPTAMVAGFDATRCRRPILITSQRRSAKTTSPTSCSPREPQGRPKV